MGRFQFSLRILLIGVLVAAVLVGIVAQEGRQRREIVADLESKGCGFMYEGDPSLPPITQSHNWLTALFGDEYFPSPVAIIVDGTSATDDDVDAIAALKSLRIIEIADASVSNVAIARLKRLRPNCYIIVGR